MNSKNYPPVLKVLLFCSFLVDDAKLNRNPVTKANGSFIIKNHYEFRDYTKRRGGLIFD